MSRCITLIARLFDSVAPDVKMISLGSAPIRRATCAEQQEVVGDDDHAGPKQQPDSTAADLASHGQRSEADVSSPQVPMCCPALIPGLVLSQLPPQTPSHTSGCVSVGSQTGLS
jgi:hypothetical protein